MTAGLRRSDTQYIWPENLLRPADVRLIYLDLNHWVSLAKAAVGHPGGRAHVAALEEFRRAKGSDRATIDRRVVPAIETVKTPWGQRLIPADELRRLLRDHREPARGRPARRPAGRPATLPRSVVERIRLEYARGRSLSEIARALTAEGVPTAHCGQRWWPSTVRAVLLRTTSA